MLYLFLIALLVIFTIGSALVVPTIYIKNNQKLAQLQADIKDLRLKKTILDSSIAGNPENVEEGVKIMNKLIPEAEDYFSIIAALEELSTKTSFIITSYDVNVKNSGTNKLSLNVAGIGDQQSFINFLQQYNLQGQRLITIENISLGKDEIGGFNLALNFYTQKASQVPNTGLNYAAALKKIEEIKKKVIFTLSETQEGITVEDYSKKSNPF